MSEMFNTMGIPSGESKKRFNGRLWEINGGPTHTRDAEVRVFRFIS